MFWRFDVLVQMTSEICQRLSVSNNEGYFSPLNSWINTSRLRWAFRQRTLPAELVVVVRIGEAGRVLQDFADTGDELVQEFSPLGVVEERPAHGRDLHEAGQRQRWQRDRQGWVEVEEQLQRAELEESRPPAGRNLQRTSAKNC